MYMPAHFEETRIASLRRLIESYPLGALVVNGPDGLNANHIPFHLDETASEHGALHAHIARANALWTQVQDGARVLVIFGAENAYVSPNWYPSKHETHAQVPTWNYRVVHVHGRLRIRDDERFVRGVVARLTRTHESRTGDARPWKMSDSSEDYIARMLAAVVGLEIEIERIVGKSKLSQNREPRDRDGAADELAKRGKQETAEAMREAARGKERKD